jgi:oligopeptide/dipeptide ABC transporter, ATP-binding protein, C-terminal domain
MERILDIDDLYVSFDTYAGEVHAVRGVTLHVDEGEVLAVVGESGCGKSVTAQTVMKLNPMPPARIPSGSITLCGKDIVATSEKGMQQIRGQLVSMIFQDPMTCLNPTKKVGKQLTETLKKTKHLSDAKCREEAVRLLKMVQIPNAEERVDQYPHEFSGGMRQRVVIAIAVACKPKILICDEPTTALDVTIQAQILKLLKDLKDKYDLTTIYITHDLGVVANVADRIAVMYAGDIVEIGKCEEVFYNPRHPYTWALLSSLPQLGVKGENLYSIKGAPPNLFTHIEGDAFAPRNPRALKIDFVKRPPYFDVSPTHKARTWLLDPRAPRVDPPEIIRNLHREVSGHV